jgi:GntR family transcriptional regulator/GntR family mannosyl-D-glycerate transport/metabolism transcriptional repressor
VTAGVNAYVNAALDRAEGVLAEARAEATRLVAAAEQQAEEIVAAAQARAVPADVSPIAHAWPEATITDQRLLLPVGLVLVDTPSKAALLTARNTIRTVPAADHCAHPADALRLAGRRWQRSAGPAARWVSRAVAWGDLVQQVKCLLTDPAGAPPRWAEAYRDHPAALVLDARNPAPLYVQLADELADDIQAGRLKGQLLPSESYLEQQHGLSRGTVRAALKLLRERGLAYTILARGTFVGPPPEQPQG